VGRFAFLPPQPLCKKDHGSLISAAFFGEWLVSHNVTLLDSSVPHQPLHGYIEDFPYLDHQDAIDDLPLS